MHLGEDFSGPIFGPALVEAYEYEDQEVIFPRLALHDRVLEKYNNDSSLRSEEHSFEQDFEKVHDLLIRDESGTYYIDYLRAGLREMDDGIYDWIGFMSRHKRLIVSGLQYSQSSKITRKYRWLEVYHNKVIDEHLALGKPKAYHDCEIRDALEEVRI